MATMLMLAPYPLNPNPRHGGLMRALTIFDALGRLGWDVEAVGLYHERFFAPQDRNQHDIVLADDATGDEALNNMVFADYLIALRMSETRAMRDALRRLIIERQPELILVEQPWPWLVLKPLMREFPGLRVVYSSQNLEWRVREEMDCAPASEATATGWCEAIKALELDLARQANTVLTISDLEGDELARLVGRPIAHVPATSTIAEPSLVRHEIFRKLAHVEHVRFAATIGSSYWPNVEGFFSLFPEGLGFLAQGEQIWAAGSIGEAIRSDPRFHDFWSINDSRLRHFGPIEEIHKGAFFSAAACVIVPVLQGGGAKQKTADAIVSGKAVIATSHAIEGYGPDIAAAVGNGIYLADTAQDFRRLVRRALREGLPGCSVELRQSLRPRGMETRLAAIIGRPVPPIQIARHP